MDPKILKKTQDTLGKIIKKPPLTDKLLSKPPFRFLHDVVTSVIKNTGCMQGLYTDSELVSENVKDKDSKIAFLQKSIDFVCKATGKQLAVKPAKVVAGHEPEKTNEYLQCLAQAINSKVDNDEIVNKLNNKGGSKNKEEKKEEKSRDREKSGDRRDREKSGDRRKRDEDKRSRDKSQDKDSRRDKDDKHREKEDRHKEKDSRSKEKEDRHKDRDDRHKDREDRHRDKDRERDRDSRHKSGRSRQRTGNKGKQHVLMEEPVEVRVVNTTPNDVDSDIFGSDNGYDAALVNPDVPMNSTFAVSHPSQVHYTSERPERPGNSDGVVKPIPRQHSVYREMRRDSEQDHENDEYDVGEEKAARRRQKRPKAARHRHRIEPEVDDDDEEDDPHTPYVSEEEREKIVESGMAFEAKMMEPAEEENEEISGQLKKRKSGTKSRLSNRKKIEIEAASPIRPEEEVVQSKMKQDTVKGPKTSTPKNSPDSPRKGSRTVARDIKKGNTEVKELNKTPKLGEGLPVKAKQAYRKGSVGESGGIYSPGKATGKKINKGQTKVDSNRIRSTETRTVNHKQKNKDGVPSTHKTGKRKVTDESLDDSTDDYRNDKENLNTGSKKSGKDMLHRRRRKNRDQVVEQSDDTDAESAKNMRKFKEKLRYRNEDYAHDKVKRSNKHKEDYSEYYDDEVGDSINDGGDETDEYYAKKKPQCPGDKPRKSSFTSVLDKKDTEVEKRDEESKENDAPTKEMVNGDHKQADGSTKIQRPSSAKGSRRRMEGRGGDSSDEDVPAQSKGPTLGEDDLPPQVTQARLARPSSARPAPPKRKEDMTQQEPAMRLGSGKPQNLIIDDGKDSDEDETFVVEESAPAPVEPEQRITNHNDDDDDEDHGGLVKKIMETKKEYEQPRKTDIERPTISDAQRRKQREAVQREIDKLRTSIQTLTRSANPLGKIMDYVQEDLDSMQKELEKWKAENKQHTLELKREKAITERAVEPLKAQLSEVDQAIKDQLDLIGAVKSNIIRNDQKMEKMLRTIAKS